MALLFVRGAKDPATSLESVMGNTVSQSQGAVGEVTSLSLSMSHLMSSCPHLAVQMGGVHVPCLVDTGSMVSTIKESCFHDHFNPWGQDQHKSCQWLQLRAANGLSIPYIGYIELDIELCGQVISKCEVLVIRDPPGGICHLTRQMGQSVYP